MRNDNKIICIIEAALPLHPSIIKHMSNWLLINEYLISTNQTPELLRDLIAYEIKSLSRIHILNRLIQRYASLEKKKLYSDFIEWKQEYSLPESL